MESVKANEDELTSTMSSLVSTSKDNKNDACDSTPTSSTDAFTTTSSSQIVADDPISSTSSDIVDSRKSTEKVEVVAQTSVNVVSNSTSSPIVSEKDLLDMNITDTSTEKITENVDDIVQDLENLLGEPTTSFDFSMKAKEGKNLVEAENRDISMDIDDFSAQLQELSDQSKTGEIEQITEIKQSEICEDVTNSNILETISEPNRIIQVSEAEEIKMKEVLTEKFDVTSSVSRNEVPDDVIKPEVTDNNEKQENQDNQSTIIESSAASVENELRKEIKEFSGNAVSVSVQGIVQVDFDDKEEQETQVTETLPQESQVEQLPITPEENVTKSSLQEIEIVVSSQADATKKDVTDSLVQEDDIQSLENQVPALRDTQKQETIAMDEPTETVVEVRSETLQIEVNLQQTEDDADSSKTLQTEGMAESYDAKMKDEVTENAEKQNEVIEESASEVVIEKVEEEMQKKPASEEVKEKAPVARAEEFEIKNREDTTPDLTESITEPTSEEFAVQMQEETKTEAIAEEIQEMTEIVDDNVHAVLTEAVENLQESTTEIFEEKLPEVIRDKNEGAELTEEKFDLATSEKESETIEENVATEMGSTNPIIPTVETHLEDNVIFQESATTDLQELFSVTNQTTPVIVDSDKLVVETQSSELDVVKTVENVNLSESREITQSEETADLEEVVPVDFIPDNIEVTPPTLVEDLDLLVQNTVNDQLQEETCSGNELTSAPLEANILPLPVEEVADLEVLNAISTLSNYKSTSDHLQNMQQSDALLTSSTLAQSQTTEVPFETNVERIRPPVDEIFNEPEVDLPDDNLETLLAVANLQNDYVQPVEDLSTSHDLVSAYVPESEEKRDLVVPEESVPMTQEPPQELVETLNEPPKIDEGKLDQGSNLKEPLVINIDDNDKDRVYSPKITIKPIKPPEGDELIDDSEISKGSLKMTITKQSDNMHSILKIYNPDDDNNHEEPAVPKLIIKPILQPNEQPQSPKMSTRTCKVFSPSSSSNQRSSSPRITIKPIPKPEESVAPLKITIKPVLKSDDSHKQKHSPKLTIKPIVKPEEENVEPKVQSPRVTIKPIVKPPDEIEQVPSPRITIKPIVKPAETENITPRVTIKPVVKHQDKNMEIVEPVERSSPKITIKPIVKPQEEISEVTEKTSPKITIKPIVKPQEIEAFTEEVDDSVKERIVLKINKGTIPTSTKESRKPEEEKLTKIKLKFSKEGGHPQIVQEQSPIKRQADQMDHDKFKRQRIEEQFLSGVSITPVIPSTHSKLKEMLSRGSDKIVTIDDDDDDVTIVEEQAKNSPIVISEESNQDSMNATTAEMRDPISEIPVFEITPDCVKTINAQTVAPVVDVTPTLPPAPRKRGRPRKVPLQVREDFKDPKEEEPKPVVIESTRPKRSCRGQSVRTTLGIKPRKPRGPGRGRGSKRGMGTRSTPTPPATPPRLNKETKLKEESFLLADKSDVNLDDALLRAPHSTEHLTDRADIVMYEEETRMSAETSSRAQTPAKQVVTTIPTVDLVEESQSSVQSTATTESVKVRKGPRLEVHQEPEGAVISADQLAEYYWMSGGPYMLQEQVAQFLGIKSFKRKYPNIPRRVVDMQERDFIRESGLACESMCDLGLTAVNSSDILDIMYSDFQDKYEEYCKHQRDRQAKDLINKQRALTLAASQEKAKLDITQQAVQSAANWNATFNKARRDQRKTCMDLQTLTIHFPKGKMKQINKPKIGYYPVALVPGQFTDYYREFTPTEINNLPLNTLCYNRVVRGVHHEMECDSQTDGSGSESETSTSDSDSSYSGSSDGEDCTLCKHTPKRVTA